MVNYLDDDMLIATMETVVFIGRNLEQDDVGKVYFQDAASYREGIRFDSKPQDDELPVRFFSGPETQTAHIFEFEQALEELMKCSLRRKAGKEASAR